MDKEDEKIENIKEQIETLKDELADLTSDEKEKYEDEARKIMDNFMRNKKEIWHKTKEKGKEVKNMVEENPWKAVGIAVAIGFIAGMLANRGKKE